MVAAPVPGRRSKVALLFFFTFTIYWFLQGAAAQPDASTTASPGAVRLLGICKYFAPEMYGAGLIDINVHCRDVLGIKEYGQSFLEYDAAQELENNYGVPFVGIGARDSLDGHGLVCPDSGAGVHLVCNEQFAIRRPGQQTTHQQGHMRRGGQPQEAARRWTTSSHSTLTAAARSSTTSPPSSLVIAHTTLCPWGRWFPRMSAA